MFEPQRLHWCILTSAPPHVGKGVPELKAFIPLALVELDTEPQEPQRGKMGYFIAYGVTQRMGS